MAPLQLPRANPVASASGNDGQSNAEIHRLVEKLLAESPMFGELDSAVEAGKFVMMAADVSRVRALQYLVWRKMTFTSEN